MGSERSQGRGADRLWRMPGGAGGGPGGRRGARGAGDARDAAVSEMVATMLLLGFSVAFFAVAGIHVASLPAPGDPARADLRVGFENVSATNAPEHRIALSHLGGDRIHLDSLAITLDGEACDLDTADSREDGNGWFDVGERLVTTTAACEGSDGGKVAVAGGLGDRRAVLLLVDLPAPTG